MPKGLKLPIGVSSTGGLAVVDGDDNDAKIIKSALMSGENENAFQQDLGLGLDMIFDIADPVVRSGVLSKIVFIFERFEIQNRFKLLKDTIKWDNNNINNGKITLFFKYLNLESDEEKEYDQVFMTGV